MTATSFEAPGSLSATDYAPESSFIVELDEFSGPLDLLLTLIREEQVEITDIPIARICDQFLHRIHSLGLAEAAEYLEMAARLLRIKVQMLLPRHGDEETWDDPRAELVRRLLEYQQMREVVDVLERLGDDRRNRFARGYCPGDPVPPPRGPLALALPELFAAVDRVLRISREPLVHEVIARALDVDGAMITIMNVLSSRSRARWRDVISDDAAPWQVLSALLALLELARRGELRVHQPSPFASMDISRDAASEAA
ncbi:MAG TPA: segregation/condensation protein A [Gemmatimonadaceae bacterium]|nr:segregation/condensation protein A [Gemmatimonadaceae bacterium]